jgi:hypothetical protein
MSTDAASADRQQMKMKEFMGLLPLTLEIAGLPHAEPGKYYNKDQMEVRANTLRNAFQIARQLVVEISTK